MNGLHKPDVRVTVELEDDKNGPRPSPGEYSVLDHLLKVFSGTMRVFQTVM